MKSENLLHPTQIRGDEPTKTVDKRSHSMTNNYASRNWRQRNAYMRTTGHRANVWKHNNSAGANTGGGTGYEPHYTHITPEEVFVARRRVMKAGGYTAALTALDQLGPQVHDAEDGSRVETRRFPVDTLGKSLQDVLSFDMAAILQNLQKKYLAEHPNAADTFNEPNGAAQTIGLEYLNRLGLLSHLRALPGDAQIAVLDVIHEASFQPDDPKEHDFATNMEGTADNQQKRADYDTLVRAMAGQVNTGMEQLHQEAEADAKRRGEFAPFNAEVSEDDINRLKNIAEQVAQQLARRRHFKNSFARENVFRANFDRAVAAIVDDRVNQFQTDNAGVNLDVVNRRAAELYGNLYQIYVDARQEALKKAKDYEKTEKLLSTTELQLAPRGDEGVLEYHVGNRFKTFVMRNAAKAALGATVTVGAIVGSRGRVQRQRIVHHARQRPNP
jgi:hypothetical protein